MKKLILFSILCLAFTSAAMAQDCDLCGTWEGVYDNPPLPDPNSDDFVNTKTKIIVRIKQYGQDMTVRMKTKDAANQSDFVYSDNCNVIRSTPTSLHWNCPHTISYDCGFKVNGKTVHCTEYSINHYVTLKNGRLAYCNSMHSIYKDSNGNLIGTHDNPISGSTYLYKDEGDW